MTGRVQSSPLSAPPRLTGAERNAGILARGGERLLHSPVAISSRGITHDLSWKRPIGELLYELIDIAPALHLRSLRDGRRAIRHPVPPSFSSHMHNSIHPLFVESLGGWCRSRDAAAAKRDTIVAQRGVAPVGSASATHTTPTATRQPRQAPRSRPHIRPPPSHPPPPLKSSLFGRSPWRRSRASGSRGRNERPHWRPHGRGCGKRCATAIGTRASTSTAARTVTLSSSSTKAPCAWSGTRATCASRASKTSAATRSLATARGRSARGCSSS